MTDKTLTIKRPDDWHLHLRDDQILAAVLPYTSAVFARAIIMPNLTPPITTRAAAQAYRQRILAAVPADHEFTPLLTAYLTDTLDQNELREGHAAQLFTAAKLYPAGATTNSQFGVTSINAIRGVLDTMQSIDMPLLVHGEVTDPDVDVFDREAVFIDTVLEPMRKDFPELRIVFEHLTTRHGVDYVLNTNSHYLGATITPHHLMIDRNALFQGGLRPHMYCLPIAKRREDLHALQRAATSGDSRFFLGTDSAPHSIASKEQDCGCAGVFNTPVTMSCVATVFEEAQALDQLEAFCSLNGPGFYKLPVNQDTITLRRHNDPVSVPAHVSINGQDAQNTPSATETIKVFDSPVPLHWS